MYTKTTFTYVFNLTFLERKLIWNPHLTYSTPSAILKLLYFYLHIILLSKCHFAPLWYYEITSFCWCRITFCSQMEEFHLLLSWCFSFIFCACFHCGFNLTTFLSHLGQMIPRKVWHSSGSHRSGVECVYGESWEPNLLSAYG